MAAHLCTVAVSGHQYKSTRTVNAECPGTLVYRVRGSQVYEFEDPRSQKILSKYALLRTPANLVFKLTPKILRENIPWPEINREPWRRLDRRGVTSAVSSRAQGGRAESRQRGRATEITAACSSGREADAGGEWREGA